jgi:hypothetical protein
MASKCSARQSWSNLKPKNWDPTNFSTRSQIWKNQKDAKIEKLRRDKFQQESKTVASVSQVVQTKDYSQVKTVEVLCPILHATKIERRTKLQISVTHRHKSKSKHRRHHDVTSKSTYSNMSKSLK